MTNVTRLVNDQLRKFSDPNMSTVLMRHRWKHDGEFYSFYAESPTRILTLATVHPGDKTVDIPDSLRTVSESSFNTRQDFRASEYVTKIERICAEHGWTFNRIQY